MRLIDADKLETTAVLGVQLQHADSRYYYFYEEETIQNAPTVKAIPIEWIEKQIKRTTDITDEKELDVLYAGNLSYMLKLWEKEKSVKISEGNYDSDEEYEEQMRCLNETNRCG